ncbi:hypothetical protein DDZ18_03655 [Marinicauda salina]|uniref:Acyltransferase n=1 Tax=Marinicauda salina TaxID=2135793 RepID=A0A2U2BXJ8_9PROT|nr:acyltransferase family protein [Marinicauda salina]PWE18699.1 hypothetical protein DDZ18_03655 [Marinicauda salina]
MNAHKTGRAGDAFRPDIQGLRAVAVLLVLVFHIFPERLSGGYVGVDVFFVISGFLITGILLRNVERDGRVRLINFYERRIRRLLPAASAALAISAPATIHFLPPTRWENIGWEIIASAFYFENFFLYFQSIDYLNGEYEPSPFQHYWSLSIEEQFYIFWPLFIWLTAVTARACRAPERILFFLVFSAVFAASLAISIISTPQDDGTYFLTQARAWELALGGMVAVAHPYVKPGPFTSSALRWAGVAFILAAGFIYTEQTAFPGYAALLPTVGAALLLITPHSPLWRDPGAMLSLPPMRYFGDISYSLYLWHWPVIIFAAAGLSSPFNLAEGLGLAVISVALAHASKFHIEDRFRDRPAGTGAARSYGVGALYLAGSCIAAATLIAPSLIAQRQAVRLSLDYGDYPGAMALVDPLLDPPDATAFIPALEAALRDNPSVYADGCHVDQFSADANPCSYGESLDGGQVVALVGDSHAAQWAPALRLIAQERGYQLITHTKSACPFLRGEVVRGSERYESCTEWNDNVMDSLLALQPDLVVTAKIANTRLAVADPAQSDEAVVAGLSEAYARLREAGINVLAIEHTPRFDFEIPDCVATHREDLEPCVRARAAVTGTATHVAEAAGRAGVPSVNMNDAICREETCPPVIGNVLVYRDAHHLTATYSRTLAPVLARHVVPLVEPGTRIDSTVSIEATAGGQERRSEFIDLGQSLGDHPGAMTLADPALRARGDAPVAPTPGEARRDIPELFREGCHARRDDVAPNGCAYGTETPKALIALVGDSHAAHWVPALRTIAESREFRLVTFTKSGCPLIGTPILLRGQEYPECVQWNDSVMERLLELQPDLVVTSMLSSTFAAGYDDPDASNAAVVEGLSSSWRRLGEAGIPVLAIRQTPRFSHDVPECVAEHLEAPSHCAETRAVALRRYDPIPPAGEAVGSARVVDLNEFICELNVCSPIVGNVLVYRDPHHLSATYSRSLAPLLANEVERALEEAVALQEE